MHRDPYPPVTEPRNDPNPDQSLDRRGVLRCMAWAGTGLLWSAGSGIPASKQLMADPPPQDVARPKVLDFVQISDTHIGFHKPPNGDVVGTLRETIRRINALPFVPEFLIHTGDLTHLAEAEQFDTLQQTLAECRVKQVFFVPGEHDVLNDDGALYRQRMAKDTLGAGWFSFDHTGVHFVGLVNVQGVNEGGLGVLGKEQLEWFAKDLAGRSAETPIVVFAHVPLWSLFPDWGWTTGDGAAAMAQLARFGSVTILNGHVHQVLQKVEGNATFHTARSTAFPQPAPGAAPKPGPMPVAADTLRSFLGLRTVTYVERHPRLAVVDTDLASS
jgi:Icc protein